MIITKRFFLLLLFGIIGFSCRKDFSNDSDIPVIDFFSTEKVKISELFDTVDIVTLETIRSSIIGPEINRIETWEGRIYIMHITQAGQNILCFDLYGNFLFKIDRKGHGPGEYSILTDFFIDRKRKEITLFPETGRCIVLNMDGNFISEQKRDIYYDRQTVIKNDSTLLVYNSGVWLPKNAELIEVDRNSFEIKDMTTTENLMALTLSSPFSVYNDNILYSHISDTIYSATNIHQLRPEYYIDLGDEHTKYNSQLGRNYSEHKDYNRHLQELSELYRDRKVSQVINLSESSNFVCVSIARHNDNNERISSHYSSAIFDKRTGKSYCLKNIEMDELGLKTLPDDIYVLGDSQGTLYCVCNYILTEAEKALIKNNNSIPNKIKNTLLNRTEDDNPFIIVLK